jgi:hypothetical protein
MRYINQKLRSRELRALRTRARIQRTLTQRLETLEEANSKMLPIVERFLMSPNQARLLQAAYKDFLEQRMPHTEKRRRFHLCGGKERDVARRAREATAKATKQS